MEYFGTCLNVHSLQLAAHTSALVIRIDPKLANDGFRTGFKDLFGVLRLHFRYCRSPAQNQSRGRDAVAQYRLRSAPSQYLRCGSVSLALKRIGRPTDAPSGRCRHSSILDSVGELVRQQFASTVGMGCVGPGCEEDILADRERLGI
jgi:hypothetical protein